MGRVFGFLEVNSVQKNEKYIWIVGKKFFLPDKRFGIAYEVMC